MSKKKTTKRKRGSIAKLDQQLQDAIKTAAKMVSDAKQAYEKAWREALELLAEEMGYAYPKDGAEFIMEDMEQEVYNNTAQEWEKHLTIYVHRQHFDWKKDEREEEIREAQAKLDELIEQSHRVHP